MSEPLGFLVWGADEPQYFAPGKVAEFADGQAISLLHMAKNIVAESGKELADFEFEMQLLDSNQIIEKHSFKTEDINNFWLVANPLNSDENGSFTPLFVSLFAGLGAGDHHFVIKVLANNELFNQGEVLFKSNGNNERYKSLIPKFENVSALREQAAEECQKEFEDNFEKERKERERLNKYMVHIENRDYGHTKYIVVKDRSTFSEEIHEVTPGDTISVDLYRGAEYELKFHDQDSSKDYANFLAIVNDSCNDNKYVVN